MHKSGGSLTQSSLLLTGKNVNWEYVSQIINLMQTTSASYLLMSSLDISRRNLALRGRESFAKVAQMAEYAREEINNIGGYYAYGKDLVNGGSVYRFRCDKDVLSIPETSDLRGSRYMICCVMSMTYRSSLEILQIFLPIFPLVTGFRTSSGWWGRLQILRDFIPKIRRRC